METVAVVWIWAMLLGAISLISVGEKKGIEKSAVPHEESVAEVDAGSETWVGNESSSVRVYWETRKN